MAQIVLESRLLDGGIIGVVLGMVLFCCVVSCVIV